MLVARKSIPATCAPKFMIEIHEIEAVAGLQCSPEQCPACPSPSRIAVLSGHHHWALTGWGTKWQSSAGCTAALFFSCIPTKLTHLNSVKHSLNFNPDPSGHSPAPWRAPAFSAQGRPVQWLILNDSLQQQLLRLMSCLGSSPSGLAWGWSCLGWSCWVKPCLRTLSRLRLFLPDGCGGCEHTALIAATSKSTCWA